METSIALALPNEADARQELEIVRKFQQTVSTLLVEGHDYGTIGGTKRPTLLKPGAEKITKLLGLADRYELIDRQENWDPYAPFFRYLIKCRLETAEGRIITEGMGECNSMESKYRWRWVYEKEIPAILSKDELPFKEMNSSSGGKFKTYRIPNDDLFTQVNTFLKMAEKRSLVDAALHAGRLSDVFTQDLEDMTEKPSSKPQQPTKATTKAPAKPKEEPSGDAPKPKVVDPTLKEKLEQVTAIAIDLGYTKDEVRSIIKDKFGVEKGLDLTLEQADQLRKLIEQGPDEVPGEGGTEEQV